MAQQQQQQKRNKNRATNKNIRFVRYGDLVLINQSSLGKLGFDQSVVIDSLDSEAISELRQRFRCTRVAIKRHINDDDFRTPTVRLLGTRPDEIDPWVEHTDNGIKYCFDITKSMFCKGNIKEKMRLSQIDCSNEVVVDLFAGIGYFAMVFAVHCRASAVHCCEWNPAAIAALRRNAIVNRVQDRIHVYEGDNRRVCPERLANRVNMGLIPSSIAFLPTACRALNPRYGRLYIHVHENVNYVELVTKSSSSEQHDDTGPKQGVSGARQQWANRTAQLARKTMCDVYPQYQWKVEVGAVTCVKQYAPHIDHMVVDVALDVIVESQPTSQPLIS